MFYSNNKSTKGLTRLAFGTEQLLAIRKTTRSCDAISRRQHTETTITMGTAIKRSLLSLVLTYLLTFNFCTCLSQALQVEFPTDKYPFQNTSLSWDERVDDLVSRLTIEEIQDQLAKGATGGGPSPEIPRLGIGSYVWATECLRGDSFAPGNSTGFPQAIGLAATFSQKLVYAVAAATGVEVRGKHNDFVKHGIFKSHTGASCFSPVINIARDARWGRNQETYGEDPFLTGMLAQSFVTGLQGQDERFIQASAGCKHFDVHGGPDNIPVPRSSFDANVTDADWRMTFLPAFKKCVDAGSLSLMCSYNRINGIPACANEKLLTDILRKEWNFKGYVVSDGHAIIHMITTHHFYNNTVDAAAGAINAGCNLELMPQKITPVFMSILDAIKQGKLTEEIVRERVKPLFYTRMRLGEFDPPDTNPYAKLDDSVVETQEHQNLAVEAAMKSFVLLKNKDQTLPLKGGKYNKVSVIGPMADNYLQLFGGYMPHQDRSFTKTPLQGISEIFPDVKNSKACLDETPCKKYDANIVRETVNGSGLVFVTLGTGQAVESEANDRPDVMLPGKQQQLLLDVISYAPGAQIVLLLFNAGPLNVTFADQSDHIGAIMECFFPAQATGDALVNVLTNKGGNSSPAGRVPITWPLMETDMPPMVNYSMDGRTYRYSKTDPLYPFGYGLSYSEFWYYAFTYNSSIKAGQNLTVGFEVKNIGDVDSDEVVQCYISWVNQSYPVPKIQLAAFERVHIPTMKSTYLTFSISSSIMAIWHNGKWIVEDATMNIYCGGQQPFQKKTASSNILSGTFVITKS